MAFHNYLYNGLSVCCFDTGFGKGALTSLAVTVANDSNDVIDLNRHNWKTEISLEPLKNLNVRRQTISQIFVLMSVNSCIEMISSND